RAQVVLVWLLIPFAPLFDASTANCQTVQPNIILINMDDADAAMLSPEFTSEYYPAIDALAQEAIRFTNVHATTPFCGPSRAALMRGQYAFNTGIRVNNPATPTSNYFPGSYAEFVARGHDQDELGVWLQDAGYRTMHIGKYHHANFDFRVPPGWDDFVLNGGGLYYNTYRFSTRVREGGGHMFTGPDDYIVDVDAQDAVHFLQTHLTANPDQPFFLYLAPLAPHYPSGGQPETGMVKREYADAPAPELVEGPSFNEPDMSDKPSHLSEARPFTSSRIEWLKSEYRSRARAVKSIDDMVATVIGSLTEDQLENTWIFLTSDNGYLLGQNRLRAKKSPYDSTTRVPLLVKGPGTSGSSADHLIAHIDICPTILDLAGAAIPPFIEAKSFEPLLDDPAAFDERGWQPAIMIENWAQKNVNGQRIDFVYTGLRMHDSIFINWFNGEYEYYDLSVDPYQIDNAIHLLPPGTIYEYLQQMKAMRNRPADPCVTINKPESMLLLSRHLDLSGFSDDDEGIKRILVTVESGTTGRFWNGNHWQDQPVELIVSPGVFDAIITGWQKTVSVYVETENEVDDLLISARSEDVDDNYGLVFGPAHFEVDGGDPLCRFAPKYQNGHEFPANRVSLQGLQSDNVSTDEVELHVVDLLTQQFYNGTGFQQEPFALEAGLIPEKGRWRLDLDLPPGAYHAVVRAFDISGNYSFPENLFFAVSNE
ncbi:MAG: sulfatase, partial [Planctomycetota bacterium]